MAMAILTFDISHKRDSMKSAEVQHYDAAQRVANSFGLFKHWEGRSGEKHKCPENTFLGTVEDTVRATKVVDEVTGAVENEKGNFTILRACCMIADDLHCQGSGRG